MMNSKISLHYVLITAIIIFTLFIEAAIANQTLLTEQRAKEYGGMIAKTLPGKVKLELVRIPRGSFMMGTGKNERGRSSDEGPLRKVTIDYDFYMGKFAVTQGQWKTVMGVNPTKRYGTGDDYPVYYVSWDECREFVTRLNGLVVGGYFRLPSEAEWEYACRAGTRTRFYFGDSLECGDICKDCQAGSMEGLRSDYMWYCGNNSPAGSMDYSSKIVGSKKANAFGLYDMHGNIWQWCLDAYHPNYKGAPVDGRAWPGAVGDSRVLRGGAWDYYAKHCRSGSRLGYVPDRQYTFHGMRLVWFEYEKYSDRWFCSWQAEQAADNMLSYQNKYGSWPKNINMEEHGYQGEKFTKNWGSSIDNDATINQIQFLGRLLDARWSNRTNEGPDISRIKEARRYLEGFNRGVDYVFEAQYDNGGWPQRYPLVNDYGDYITFNDNAMINVMNLLRDIGEGKGYGFVDAKKRGKAKAAYERGLECILKCQVKIGGRLTIWGAQHDQLTLEPRGARSFEPAGLCSRESGEIVLYLMGFEKPSRQIIEAVEAAVAWFEENKIEGRKVVVQDGTKKLVVDAEADPMWARFYEIETMRPIFAGRDAVVKYDLKEIDNERIMGYGWYVTSPGKVLEEYPKWKKRISR